MKIKVCKDYAELSRCAADEVVAQLTAKPDSVLGLCTGSTPEGTYACLAEDFAAGRVSFAQATSYNLDEYYPLAADHEQSYHYFMNYHLFSRVDMPADRHFVPNGEATDSAEECKRYEAAVAAAGYADLQLLGIGVNGHIGFNEPDSFLVADTHETALTESTLQANARFFDDPADVPTRALTMGVGTIMKAHRIILLASGKGKHAAIKALLDDKVTTACPATLLKLHPNVLIICDEEAYNG